MTKLSKRLPKNPRECSGDKADQSALPVVPLPTKTPLQWWVQPADPKAALYEIDLTEFANGRVETEPRRVFRRPVWLSHAAMAACSV
jgi:hypothetical protein